MNIHAHKLLFMLILFCLCATLLPAQAPEQWVSLTHNLPNTDVRALTFADGILYAGTWGNGVFRYDPDQQSWTGISEGLDKRAISHLAGDGLGNLYTFANTTNDVDHDFCIRAAGSGTWQVVDLGYEISMPKTIDISPDNHAYLSFYALDSPAPPKFKITNPGLVVNELKHDLPFIGRFAFSDSGTVYALDGFLLGGSFLYLTSDDFENFGVVISWDNVFDASVVRWRKDILWIAMNTPNPVIHRVAPGPVDVEMPPLPPAVISGYNSECLSDIVIRASEEVFVARRLYNMDFPEPAEGLGIFRLNDNRTGWSNVSRGLGGTDVRRLLLGADGTTLYAATGGGVFKSTTSVPVELATFSAE